MADEAAPAKINLTLSITGRRADGYHLLDSLVVFAGAHDRLQAAAADTLSLTIGGPFAAGLSAGPDNLVLRAARALAELCGVRLGAAIHLEKHLPVASGIGGGSSDAAAALRLLVALWDASPAPADLLALAAGLGADVPVCVTAAPRRMSGIGEVLTDAPAIPSCGMVLVNPGIALPTGPVFAARDGAFSTAPKLPGEWPDAASMAADLAMLANDLERPAIGICPEIGQVLDALRRADCLLARMSGSGATCFALFPTAADAERAAERLARPGWWCWGGALWPHFTPPRPAPNDGREWGVAKR